MRNKHSMSDYVNMGTAIGLCAAGGILLGAIFSNLILGLIIGVAIGVVLGAVLQLNIKKKR